MKNTSAVLAAFQKEAAIDALVPEVALEQVPAVLRAMAHELHTSRVKLAEYEKYAQAEKLVVEMEERGFADPSTPRAEKIAAILNSGKDLTVLAEAMNLDLGDIANASVSDEDGEGSGDAITRFLVGK